MVHGPFSRHSPAIFQRRLSKYRHFDTKTFRHVPADPKLIGWLFTPLSLLRNKYMYVVFQTSPVEIHVAYLVSVKIVMVGVTVYLWKYNIGCKRDINMVVHIRVIKYGLFYHCKVKSGTYISTPVSIYVPGRMNYCRICYSTFPTLFTKQWYCIIFEKFHILWFYLNSGKRKICQKIFCIQSKKRS